MRTKIKTIPLKTYLCGALLLGAGLMPTSALAQDTVTATGTKSADPTLSKAETEAPAVDDTTDISVAAAVGDEQTGETDDDKSWSLTASLSTRIYQGMFVGLENPDSNLSSPNAASTSNSFSRWSNIYTVGAGLKVSDFNFSATAAASHWMSRGDGMNGPYEFRLQDLVLNAGWNGYNIDAIDTRIAANYTLTAPTSTVSRTANLIVGNYLGVSISKTFMRKLGLSYSITGGWTPHSESFATIDREDAQIYREDELIGNDVRIPGGYQTEFSLSHTFAASFPVWDKLRASATYTYGSAWSEHFADADDPFTSPQAGVQSGRNYGDGTTATAGLSYPLNDYLRLAGGISTSQQPKTDENRGFRFPWWNFNGAAANRSSVNLSLSGTY